MPTFTGIYKQIPINSKLIIPTEKPDIEYILDSSVQVLFDKVEVIDTPLVYPEDTTLPLKKVIVVGHVKIIIKYSALEPTQKVHAAHFDVPFCTLIEWPDGPPQGTPITIIPVIEKQVFLLEDLRRILKALVIRFDVYQ